MTATPEGNFTERLVRRLGPFSCLIDAATGETISPSDLPRVISWSAATFLSAGLMKGDRVLIGCALSPASSIAYLGAMYAGLVSVPVEDKTLAASGDKLVREIDAKAVWTEKNQPLKWLSDESIPHLHGYPTSQAHKRSPPLRALRMIWRCSGLLQDLPVYPVS